jgi:hypothetical protein
MKKDFKVFLEKLIEKIISFDNEEFDFNTSLSAYDHETEKLLVDRLIEDFENIKIKKIKVITKDLDYLYKNSIENNYYFFDCPLEVYKNYFDVRFLEYQKDFIDGELEDFIKQEIRLLNFPPLNRDLRGENGMVVIYDDFIMGYKYNITLSKKLKFLSEKQKIINSDIDNQISAEVTIDKEINDEKVKKTNQMSTNQMVVLLDRLRFFENDYIQKLSKTKQSLIISKITGYNEKNIRTRMSDLEIKQSALTKTQKDDMSKIDDFLLSLE